MGLKESLNEFEKEVKNSLPEGFLAVLHKGIEELAAGGLEESAVKIGEKTPPFALKNAFGELVVSEADPLRSRRLPNW